VLFFSFFSHRTDEWFGKSS
jgi:hypothetical protein